MNLCRYYGSAAGCREGNKCRFSHANPNSVPFCMHFDNGCRNGNKCYYRHQIYSMQSNMSVQSHPQKHQQHRPVLNNTIERVSKDETEEKEKLVYGYIRKIPHSFGNQTDPKDLYVIVLSYYFRAFWDIQTTHPMIEIKDKCITLSHLFNRDEVSAFSLDGVEKGSQKLWKLKILKFTGKEILIGIMDNPLCIDEYGHKANEKFWRFYGGYAYWSGGKINAGSVDEGTGYEYIWRNYGPKYRENDEISVHLDMKRFPYQLSFSVNGENRGPIPFGLKKSDKYYLGVGLSGKGDCVEIIDIE